MSAHEDEEAVEPPSLSAAACAVLRASEPLEKVALSHRVAAAWREGRITAIGAAPPPERPARPDLPVL